MVTHLAAPVAQDRHEALLSLGYFSVYLAYLFIHLESEAGHWISLVALPFVLLYLYQRRRGHAIRETFASVGLQKATWHRGLGWAAAIGIALSVAQLFLSNRSEQIWEMIASGKALYAFPLTFGLMLLTAGFTEEFFFRGIVQTRLGALFRNRLWAVLVTSVLFGLYHLPYAYLNPRWPSHGDLGAALEASMGQGVVGGLVLGAVYEGSRKNLLASVIVHALINTLPAMTMLKIGRL